MSWALVSLAFEFGDLFANHRAAAKILQQMVLISIFSSGCANAVSTSRSLASFLTILAPPATVCDTLLGDNPSYPPRQNRGEWQLLAFGHRLSSQEDTVQPDSSTLGPVGSASLEIPERKIFAVHSHSIRKPCSSWCQKKCKFFESLGTGGKEKSHVVGYMHDHRGSGRVGCHADPTISYSGRGKGHLMRQVGRLVKKRKQNSSEDHCYSAAGCLSQQGQ